MGLKPQTDVTDATAVEEFIGSAFDVVKRVSDNLDNLLQITEILDTNLIQAGYDAADSESELITTALNGAFTIKNGYDNTADILELKNLAGVVIWGTDGLGNTGMSGDITCVNISPSGTVDGRDIAADGIKLDGIEVNAKDDQIASEVPYTNTTSGLVAVNVQTAVDEVVNNFDLHIIDAVDAHDASAVSNIPSGNILATDVQAAINELDGQDVTIQSNLDSHITASTDAHDASTVSNIAAGNIVAVTVQAAINELDTEKEPTFSKNTGFNKNLGIIAGTVSEGDHVHTGVYEPIDATILRDADIGVTIQAYNATNVLDADVTYELLNTNGDVGTGIGQLAIGNHIHAASAVTNIPAGNIVATDVQAAINELDGQDTTTQSNVDTVQSNLNTHAADTTTHGTTGDIVGTSNTQTLTNKTLTSPVLNTPDMNGGTADDLTALSVAADSDGNIARWVATTSAGASGTFDYWAKIATINIGASGYRAAAGRIHLIDGYTTNSGSSATINYRIYQDTVISTGSDCYVESAIDNHFSGSNFKLIAASTAIGTDIELWIKRSGEYGKFWISELMFAADNSDATITYHDNAAWQASAPTGAINITSNWAGSETFVPYAYGVTTEGTGTYTGQFGTLIRRNGFVYFKIELGWTAHTGTGNLRIKGLPYSSDGKYALTVYPSGLLTHATVVRVPYAITVSGSTAIQLVSVAPGTGGALNIVMDTDVASLNISGFYKELL